MLVVPFVDVVATMSDPTLPATVMEYEVLLTLLALRSSHAGQAQGVADSVYCMAAGTPPH